MARLGTLDRDISPPPLRKSSAVAISHAHDAKDETLRDPSLAAIEAGEAEIRDHLAYFVKRLSAVVRPSIGPKLSFNAFEELYKRNQHKHGHHFVVHQHDHPISGVHYDLRLQFSDTSSISFAVPYGLPGNPNSQRPNRMAIETRVHNIWNHLIESASHATGSLLMWDTGEYEVLARSEEKSRRPLTDDEASDRDHLELENNSSESEKLFKAFQTRHLRLRLHGVKLPKNYTISLRLPRANDKSAQPGRPKHKRRRMDRPNASKAKALETDNESDSAPTAEYESEGTPAVNDMAAALASEDDEDTTIRANNAYTGSENTIGSIHQRHWFLTLDRRSSGFRKARNGPDAGQWVGDWEPFFVYGRDQERSVVTGRAADDVMADEGIEKFMGRKMWRPIIE